MTKKKTPHGDQPSPKSQTEPSTDLELLTLKLQDTEQKLSQMTELGRRAVADMENMRRRMAEDRDRMALFANAELIKGLLPIVDNFRRAERHFEEMIKREQEEKLKKGDKEPITMPEAASGYFKGIDLITEDLNRLLEREGVKKIEALNKPFDPTFHEAVTMAKGPKDTVIEVLEDGFMLGTHVLRPAKVKIGEGE